MLFSPKKLIIMNINLSFVVYIVQLIVWQNSKLFGKIPGADVVRDAIKAFNSPPSIAEK
jgi:hypothetical protein